MSGDAQPRRVRFPVRGANEDQCRRNAAQVARMWWADAFLEVCVELSHEIQLISSTSAEGKPAGVAGFQAWATVTAGGRTVA